MHYIIDAYNLLFHLAGDVRPIEKTRNELIESLSDDLAQVGIRATLVFDSGSTHLGNFPHLSHRKASRILFSPHGMSADDYIVELLQAADPYQNTIVTSDQPLASRCKQTGASIQSLDSFLQYLSKKHRQTHTIPEKPSFFDPTFDAYLQQVFEEKLDDPLH